jgi:hypothetical protein
MSQRLMVEETALAGVALLRHDDLDADQLGLVRQHLDEAGVRQEDKGLVIPLPKLGLLFPPIVLPNHERSDLMGDEVVNAAATGRMELAVHLAEALVGEEVEAL